MARRGDVPTEGKKPGPQSPGKYPSSVGPNYLAWGEQPGFVYNPYTDTYHADKKAYEEYLYSSGQAERPKGPPSLMETVAPVAALGGAYALSQGFGEKIGKEGLGSILPDFGFGGSGAAATTAPQATAGLTGLQGLGQAAAPATPTGLTGKLIPVGDSAPSGMFDLGGIGTEGNAILPVAGAFGAYDLLSKKKHGMGGALQGAASGAAMGSYFGLPGAAIGAGIGGLTGFFGNFGDEDKWKTEGDRLRKLKDQGVAVPQALIDSMPQAGRTKQQLIEEAQRTGGNVQFAGSRKESDLKPQDIVGYAAFAENDPTWFSKPLTEQLKVAQQALDAGAVREHHGTIDIDFSKINQPAAPAAQQNATSRPTEEQMKRWRR